MERKKASIPLSSNTRIKRFIKEVIRMNKKLGIIIGVVLVLVAVIAAVFLLKGNKEKEIPIVDISGTDILSEGVDRDNLANRLDADRSEIDAIMDKELTDEELQQVSKFEDAANSLYVLADAELKLILAGQSNYSRAGALLAIRQTLEKRIYDLGEVLDDPYSMKALDEISIEITEKLERELPQDGWKDPNAKSEDSLSAAGFLTQCMCIC